VRLSLLFSLVLSLSSPLVAGDGVWTTDCRLLATQRLDPIVYPGFSEAGHVHTVVGASLFSKDSTFEGLQNSKCTSCDIPLDLSNYWVPQMYVKKATDGKFYFLDNYMAVYYKLLNDRGGVHAVNNPIEKGDFHSFPPGFRMLAGSPMETQPQPSYINHKCMGDNFVEDTPGFPPRPELCIHYIRSEVTFPSCWDGRLDTEDMAADPHVVYPSPSWRAGVCPESHSKRLPTVFFEALFRPGGVYQPGDQLYYSFNDTTGYGFHGDFFNGWQDGLIDEILEGCRTHVDNGIYQCSVNKEREDCVWEGGDGEDPDQYRGVLDTLPPWDGPWRYGQTRK